MITEEEIKELSKNLDVPLSYIEKDYVMGWLLNGIFSNNSELSNKLVLKGGNCLRKIYFPDTRFSDDLDFTMIVRISPDSFKSCLNKICKNLKNRIGIPFQISNTRVEEKNVIGRDFIAIDGRVYFKGFAGDSSITMRIKFDVSEYEKIFLPLQEHPLIHEYSDKDQCQVQILAYSLEEVLAEKLRSWIQRTRAHDLFDVVKIIQSGVIPINKTRIFSTFLQKTIFKNIPLAGRDEILYEDKFNRVEKTWSKSIICSKNSLIIFKNAIDLFKDFINAIFSKEMLGTIKQKSGFPNTYLYNIQSGIREGIIEAGRARKLIRMRYNSIDRTIEPYSFRYKVIRGGIAREYFYGFDRTRGNTIKSFLLHQIQQLSILPHGFTPQWTVEF